MLSVTCGRSNSQAITRACVLVEMLCSRYHTWLQNLCSLMLHVATKTVQRDSLADMAHVFPLTYVPHTQVKISKKYLPSLSPRVAVMQSEISSRYRSSFHGARSGRSASCITGAVCRSHLCVKVRGGYIGGAARAAWKMLRRNGITPLRPELEGAAGDGPRGNINDGESTGAGTNGCTTSVAIAEDMAGVERLKAVMELGKRDSVRRLLKQVMCGDRSLLAGLPQGTSGVAPRVSCRKV